MLRVGSNGSDLRDSLAQLVSRFMSDQVPLIALLDTRRAALNMNWAEVAEAIGCAESTVSRWRSGVVPSRNYTPGIARFLGVDEGRVDELTRGEPRPHGRRSPAELADRVEELTGLLRVVIEQVGGSDTDTGVAVQRLTDSVRAVHETMEQVAQQLELNAEALERIAQATPGIRPASQRKRPPSRQPRTS